MRRPCRYLTGLIHFGVLGLLIAAGISVSVPTFGLAASPSSTPVPWPTVIPQHKHQARLILSRFSRAVLRGHTKQAKRYLAASFRGRCGYITSASQSLTIILCQIPRPARYRIFSIENGDRLGTMLDAVVIYRLKNGRRQPLAFNIRETSSGWAITSIGLLQG